MRRIMSLIIITLLVTMGCAVLTPSQVTEVEKFAKATAAYSTMPNEVMKAHAELRSDVKIANASGALTGKAAWKLLKQAERFEDKLAPLANRAEKACTVLKNYGNLLSALTADDHTAKLQASAEQLGSSLDSAISKYNESSGKSIGTFGSAAAALVRRAGGLYIKRKQTIALQKAVKSAEPAVKEMAVAISSLLNMYTTPEKGMELISSEKKELINWYKVKGYKGPLSTSRTVTDEIKKADAAIKLAEQSRSAIDKLESAHEELANKLKSKMTLADAIETVQVFVDEVESAKELYDKLSKK